MQKTAPLLHQPPPLLQQIPTVIGCFHLTAQRMLQRHLADLAWIVRGLCRPGSEGCAKAMRDGHVNL